MDNPQPDPHECEADWGYVGRPSEAQFPRRRRVAIPAMPSSATAPGAGISAPLTVTLSKRQVLPVPLHQNYLF